MSALSKTAACALGWSLSVALCTQVGCSTSKGVGTDGGTAEPDAGDPEPDEEDADIVPQGDATLPSVPDAGGPSDAGRPSDAGKPPDATTAADSAVQGSSTDGGGALCPGLGWCELTDTKLAAVCPDPAKYPAIQANEGCGGVINDWGGGSADEKRNRLLVWGGGHRGYFGNEVYALDLNKLAMQRLNEPSDVSSVDLNQCTSPEAYADGRPGSRHTYDGLAYFPDADRMFSLGGSGIPCGYAVQGTWTLDLATVSATPLGTAAPWTNMKPTPFPSKATYGVVADYDPNTKRVIVNDTYSLWSYDLAGNSYSVLNDSDKTGAHIDYHMTGRVDPKRKLFVVVGGRSSPDGGMQVFDISAAGDHAQQNWTSQVSGCDGLMAASSPGFAYDPIQDRMIGWAGGETIYVLDLDAKHCETRSYAGGPGAQNENGTFGRFRYFPALKLFAVVNDHRKNGYTLRLTK